MELKKNNNTKINLLKKEITDCHIHVIFVQKVQLSTPQIIVAYENIQKCKYFITNLLQQSQQLSIVYGENCRILRRVSTNS